MKEVAPGSESPAESGISPSSFMRNLRPEYYSDTEDRSSYSLDRASLEFQLDTITQRNHTQEFEVFCRKLCERVICPNLRPQTGPEGGGDSKTDSETYPVADEISLVYLGEPNAGKERWAFAFSAKARWTDKVRSDVKGIVGTGRKYDRIICVTSRSARSKDRAALEDELLKEYGVPVTIHDRSWISKEIIEGDRKDLAFNYLHVGQEVADPLRLGPTDYSRARQLADIEKALDEPTAFAGMERQRSVEALVAAKLSRNLERPRTETDGRFIRAIRLANAHGSNHQKLEAHYESLWTAFWWFDDVNLVNQGYDQFESAVSTSRDARDTEFLCNLFQLLINSVVHGLLTHSASKLDERAVSLRKLLEPIAADSTRPNNALEADTSLLVLKLSLQWIDDKAGDRSAIWQEFSALLDRAAGMGEFDADSLVKMIKVAAPVGGADPAYGALIEKLADFVSKRKGEAEGALILLERAQALDLDEKFEIIRLLGKAAIGLTKKEYNAQLIEAVQLLMVAYRSAGLLWASRSACAFASASIVIEGERDSELPVGFVPTMKIWAWIALELGYVPDFLSAIQLLNGAIAVLPLDDSSKERVHDDLQELDVAFGSALLTLDESGLRALEVLPDLLEGLHLINARSALLYVLGYKDVLLNDGSIPMEEPEDAIVRTYSIWASQPAADEIRRPFILNQLEPQVRSTAILGMAVHVHHCGTVDSTINAETLLAALETFFATVVEHHVSPHTESLRIDILEANEGTEALVVASDTESLLTLNWPQDLSPKNFGRQDELRKLLLQVAAMALHHTCATADAGKLIDTLFANESVTHRIAMIVATPNSYSRAMAKPLSLMSDWPLENFKSYPIRADRPTVERADLPGKHQRRSSEIKVGEMPSDHRALGVRSVIDVRSWGQAGWKGVAYLQFREDYPPVMALLFKNGEAARRIFDAWRKRFGPYDEKDEIYVGIARQISEEHPYHYGVIISSERPGDTSGRQVITVATRSLTMEALTDAHLSRFLDTYGKFRAYYLAPAVLTASGEPDILSDTAVLKRKLSVKDAANISDNELEAILLPSLRGKMQRSRP